MIRFILDALIALYQRTLSPDHGFISPLFPYGFCRFSPSCSQYARTALARHGTIKGGIRALWRVLRCNPFSKSRHDPM